MPRVILLLALIAWAAFRPLDRSSLPARSKLSEAADPDSAAGLPWPDRWEGRPLKRLPLSESERKFAGDFPFAIARFTDGSREILFRRVDRATRALHPSQDCLRAAGYALKPLPAWTDAEGRAWSRTEARPKKGKGETLEIREIVCAEGGACWPDVSSWFWSAALGRSEGPWTAVTVSRQAGPGGPET